jgi:predicted Zn-dependent protease
MDAIAERAGTLSANTRAAQGALALRRSISPIVDTLMKNGFSQPQEFAADAKALELLDAAGYDPRAILVMLQKLQQVQSGRRDGFNSTHPSPRDRIANITAILNRYKPNNTQSYRQQRFINK